MIAWKVVSFHGVRSPEWRKFFKQFVNTEETETGIEIIDERGQKRPADWPRQVVPVESITLPDGNGVGEPATPKRWVEIGKTWDFPADGGSTVKYGGVQIAVFNFASRGEWYATQNMCPHMNAFVLSRGIVGDSAGTPKVACPLHKKNFSLETGECMTGDCDSIQTFPVKVEGDSVFLELPPEGELDGQLATDLHCIKSSGV